MARAGNGGSPLRRKIQRLGASSLIVTLPKDWARRHHVSVGDMVSIYDEGDKLVIVPDGVDNRTDLAFSLNNTSVDKHAGRVLLCSYIFGFDGVIFTSSKNIKETVMERLREASSLLPESRVTKINEKTVFVDLGEKDGRLEDLLVTYGKSISRMLARLSAFLNGRIVLSKQDLEREYNSLMRLNYKMLRIANSVKGVEELRDRQYRYMVSASNLIGLAADAIYKLGLDLIDMAGHLEDNERERLSFILQILEVAVSTVVLSLNPPSVKKAEESYEKVREIMKLEGDLADVVSNSSPAFAYLLAKAIDVARIVEISEQVMLCHALITKYATKPSENGNGAGL